MATGVLPLVVGRATRLARFLSASDKTYEASIRLGFATDTDDAQGQPIGAGVARAAAVARRDRRRARRVPRHVPAAAAGVFGEEDRRHAQLQAGARARAGAACADRADRPTCRTCPARPGQRHGASRSSSSASTADTRDARVSTARPASTCGRSRTISGERLGIGAHLAALRRTRSGDFTLDAGDRARRGSSAMPRARGRRG